MLLLLLWQSEKRTVVSHFWLFFLCPKKIKISLHISIYLWSLAVLFEMEKETPFGGQYRQKKTQQSSESKHMKIFTPILWEYFFSECVWEREIWHYVQETGPHLYAPLPPSTVRQCLGTVLSAAQVGSFLFKETDIAVITASVRMGGLDFSVNRSSVPPLPSLTSTSLPLSSQTSYWETEGSFWSVYQKVGFLFANVWVLDRHMPESGDFVALTLVWH